MHSALVFRGFRVHGFCRPACIYADGQQEEWTHHSSRVLSHAADELESRCSVTPQWDRHTGGSASQTDALSCATAVCTVCCLLLCVSCRVLLVTFAKHVWCGVLTRSVRPRLGEAFGVVRAHVVGVWRCECVSTAQFVVYHSCVYSFHALSMMVPCWQHPFVVLGLAAACARVWFQTLFACPLAGYLYQSCVSTALNFCVVSATRLPHSSQLQCSWSSCLVPRCDMCMQRLPLFCGSVCNRVADRGKTECARRRGSCQAVQMKPWTLGIALCTQLTVNIVVLTSHPGFGSSPLLVA